MQRHLATLALLLLHTSLYTQTLVGTGPQPRTALLEEFTAIRCGVCPSAHAIANSLEGLHGEALTIIAVHGGGLAVPLAGQPDFRTAEGSAIWGMLGVVSQPQGSVNRRPIQGPNGWSGAIGSVLSQDSPANIGLSTAYDVATRNVTVEVEVYYTSTLSDEDRIHVALTQDDIVGWQTDYVNGNHPDYIHRHVLRGLMTPVEGDPVMDPAEGALVQRTYAMTIPEAWDIDALSAVAFIGAAQGEVHQVRSVPAAGGATVGLDSVRSDLPDAPFPVPASHMVSVPLPAGHSGQATLFDAFGREVRSERVPMGAGRVLFAVHDLLPGTYFVRFEGGGAQRIVVAR